MVIPLTRRRPGTLLAVLLAGQTMASMDGSIVTVALPSIQRDLGADGAALQLVASAYLLTLGLLIVTGARLGDVLGYRRAFLAGLAGFTVASLLCGLAPSVPVLVAARVLQAGAAALMVPQVFSLIQLRFDGTARDRAIALYSMVLALGVALGQFVGGLVIGADLFGLTWRPAFLINVPAGVVLLVAGARALPAAAGVVRRLDLAGVGLLTTAMTALVTPLIFGREHGWRPWAWASLLAGAVLLVVFARVERRIAERGGHPLLDLDVLRPAGVRPALAACFVVMGCYAAFLFALTLHLQGHLGFGPFGAGLAFVPYAVGFAALSLTWTRLPGRVRAALPVVGPALFALAAVVVVAVSGDGWRPEMTVPLLFVAGAGHAAGYGPLIAGVSSVLGPERASALSALNSTGPVLASVGAIAGLGGLYLAAGLAWTTAAIALLLVGGAACAATARAAWHR
ncbi:MFS transporter [Sphaerisporangium corydalis]|uniref:MFS transporter n=1 Tax=Sphaerisporangium corydalis TaxID=1441875 RepID=A0ABV9EP64_9ACTN|nr:MFS transporter [Sphaerisporangium corydalis]